MASSILNSDDGVISGTSGLKSTGGDDGVLLIQTNGTTAQTVDAGQRTKFPTTIGVGGATPSTSGSGITFPATQSASSNANTLDDYEEGTWTPAIIGFTTAGTGTYSVQIGRYVKIGNRVWVDIMLQWSAHTGTGDMGVTNLPFNILALTNYFPPLTTFTSDITLTANNICSSVFLQNTGNIEINQQPTGGGAFTQVAMDTAGRIRLSGNYITA